MPGTLEAKEDGPQWASSENHGVASTTVPTAGETVTATSDNSSMTSDASPSRKGLWGKVGGAGAEGGGLDMKEKFKLKARQVIDLTNIKNAITSLHSVQKLRKDNELLSTIKSLNMGLDDRMTEVKRVIEEDENFMNDTFKEFDHREVYRSESPRTMLSPSKIESMGDAGLVTLAKIQERKRERERLQQKKLETAIRSAGTISVKEREHYVTMCSHFELMAAKLKRRDDMIRQMRHHLQLDTTIRAGGHSLQDRINQHGEHASSVHEQISTLHRALQSGDECEVLQLKDEIDVLYREFQLQTDSMVVMKQKMDHMVNHSREVALRNEKHEIELLDRIKANERERISLTNSINTYEYGIRNLEAQILELNSTITSIREEHTRTELEWDANMTSMKRLEMGLRAELASKEEEIKEKSQRIEAAQKAADEKVEVNEEIKAWQQKYADLVQDLDQMVAMGSFDRSERKSISSDGAPIKESFEAFKVRRQSDADQKKTKKSRRKHSKEMIKKGIAKDPTAAPDPGSPKGDRQFFAAHHTHGDTHAHARFESTEEDDEEIEEVEEDTSSDDGDDGDGDGDDDDGDKNGKGKGLKVKLSEDAALVLVKKRQKPVPSGDLLEEGSEEESDDEEGDGGGGDGGGGDSDMQGAFASRLFSKLKDKETELEKQKQTVNELRKDIQNLSTDTLRAKKHLKQAEEKKAKEIASFQNREALLNTKVHKAMSELNLAQAEIVTGKTRIKTLELDLKQANEQILRFKIKESVRTGADGGGTRGTSGIASHTSVNNSGPGSGTSTPVRDALAAGSSGVDGAGSHAPSNRGSRASRTKSPGLGLEVQLDDLEIPDGMMTGVMGGGYEGTPPGSKTPPAHSLPSNADRFAPAPDLFKDATPQRVPSATGTPSQHTRKTLLESPSPIGTPIQDGGRKRLSRGGSRGGGGGGGGGGPDDGGSSSTSKESHSRSSRGSRVSPDSRDSRTSSRDTRDSLSGIQDAGSGSGAGAGAGAGGGTYTNKVSDWNDYLLGFLKAIEAVEALVAEREADPDRSSASASASASTGAGGGGRRGSALTATSGLARRSSHSYGTGGQPSQRRESISLGGSGGNSGPGSSASSASSSRRGSKDGGIPALADSIPFLSLRALLAAIKKDIPAQVLSVASIAHKTKGLTPAGPGPGPGPASASASASGSASGSSGSAVAGVPTASSGTGVATSASTTAFSSPREKQRLIGGSVLPRSAAPAVPASVMSALLATPAPTSTVKKPPMKTASAQCSLVGSELKFTSEAGTQTSLEGEEAPTELPLLRIFRALRMLTRSSVPHKDLKVLSPQDISNSFFPLFRLAVDTNTTEAMYNAAAAAAATSRGSSSPSSSVPSSRASSPAGSRRNSADRAGASPLASPLTAQLRKRLISETSGHVKDDAETQRSAYRPLPKPSRPHSTNMMHPTQDAARRRAGGGGGPASAGVLRPGYSNGHEPPSLASEPGSADNSSFDSPGLGSSRGATTQSYPQHDDTGSPGSSRPGSAVSTGSGGSRSSGTRGGGGGHDGSAADKGGRGGTKNAKKKSSLFEQRRPSNDVSSVQEGRSKVSSSSSSSSRGGVSIYGVDASLDVKVKLQVDPHLQTVAPSASDVAATARAQVSRLHYEKEKRQEKGKQTFASREHEAAQAHRKVESALGFVVAANAMRNRMLSEISLYPAWDTTNTRMLIRCLDLVLQSCYALLTVDNYSSSSSDSNTDTQGHLDLREIDAAFRDVDLPSFRGGNAARTTIGTKTQTQAQSQAEISASLVPVSDEGEGEGAGTATTQRSQALSASDRRAATRSLLAATLTKEEAATEVYALLNSVIRQEQQQEGRKEKEKERAEDGFPSTAVAPADADPSFNVLELYTPSAMLTLWLSAIKSAQADLDNVYKAQLPELLAAAAASAAGAGSNAGGNGSLGGAGAGAGAGESGHHSLSLASVSDEGSFVYGDGLSALPPGGEAYSLMSSNQPASVSPRGRPTTGEPYRALLAHMGDYMLPMKVVLDKKTKGHYGKNRGFLAKTISQERKRVEVYQEDIARSMSSGAKMPPGQSDATDDVVLSTRRSLSPSASGNKEANIIVARGGVDSFLSSKQAEQEQRNEHRRGDLLAALERRILADAAQPQPGEMDFPTSMLYTAGTNLEQAQEQRLADLKEHRQQMERRRQRREDDKASLAMSDDDDVDEDDDGEDTAAVAPGLSDTPLDADSFPVMITKEEFERVPAVAATAAENHQPEPESTKGRAGEVDISEGTIGTKIMHLSLDNNGSPLPAGGAGDDGGGPEENDEELSVAHAAAGADVGNDDGGSVSSQHLGGHSHSGGSRSYVSLVSRARALDTPDIHVPQSVPPSPHDAADGEHPPTQSPFSPAGTSPSPLLMQQQQRQAAAVAAAVVGLSEPQAEVGPGPLSVDELESDFEARRMRQRLNHQAFLQQQEQRREQWLEWQREMKASGKHLEGVDMGSPVKVVDQQFSLGTRDIPRTVDAGGGLSLERGTGTGAGNGKDEAARTNPVSRRDRARASFGTGAGAGVGVGVGAGAGMATEGQRLTLLSSRGAPQDSRDLDEAGRALVATRQLLSMGDDEGARRKKQEQQEQQEREQLLAAALKGSPDRSPRVPGTLLEASLSTAGAGAGAGAAALSKDYTDDASMMLIRGQRRAAASASASASASVGGGDGPSPESQGPWGSSSRSSGAARQESVGSGAAVTATEVMPSVPVPVPVPVSYPPVYSTGTGPGPATSEVGPNYPASPKPVTHLSAALKTHSEAVTTGDRDSGRYVPPLRIGAPSTSLPDSRGGGGAELEGAAIYTSYRRRGDESKDKDKDKDKDKGTSRFTAHPPSDAQKALRGGGQKGRLTRTTATAEEERTAAAPVLLGVMAGRPLSGARTDKAILLPRTQKTSSRVGARAAADLER